MYMYITIYYILYKYNINYYESLQLSGNKNIKKIIQYVYFTNVYSCRTSNVYYRKGTCIIIITFTGTHTVCLIKDNLITIVYI